MKFMNNKYRDSTGNEHDPVMAPSAAMLCIVVVIAMVLSSLLLAPSMGCRKKVPTDDEIENEETAGEFGTDECGFDAEEYMRWAVDSLEALGEAEMMASGENNGYGTFDRVTRYIHAGSHVYDLEGYYILDMIVDGSYRESTTGGKTFTITAYPERDKSRFLKTFAMLDDAVVRVYNPDNRNVLNHICSWDPIL